MLKNTGEKKDTESKGRNSSNCCPHYCRKEKQTFLQRLFIPMTV